MELGMDDFSSVACRIAEFRVHGEPICESHYSKTDFQVKKKVPFHSPRSGSPPAGTAEIRVLPRLRACRPDFATGVEPAPGTKPRFQRAADIKQLLLRRKAAMLTSRRGEFQRFLAGAVNV
jgi:hypothetical protein